MNRRKTLINLATAAGCLCVTGALLIGSSAYYVLSEAEHELEIKQLENQLEEAETLVELYKQLSVKAESKARNFEEVLEHTNTAPLYDIPLSDDLQQYTYDVCMDYNIVDKYDMVLALMWRESDFKADAVSSTNDYGLMQINAVHFTDDFDVTDALDPRANIEYGVYTLSCLYEDIVDDNMVLMSYNMGRCGATELWEQGTYASNYSLDILDKVKLIRTNQYYK